jgi:hypothetical protein
VNKIKTYFSEMGWGGMNFITLAQDRDQWRVLEEHSNELNCWVLHPVARVSTNAFS